MPPTATMATATYTANPWQFAGAFYDSTTGLYKFGIRYYDPTLGRWTQQDPLGGSLFDPSTGNRYAYTNDDPTNLTDPTGADSVLTPCFIGGVTVGLGVFGAAVLTAVTPPLSAFVWPEVSTLVWGFIVGCVSGVGISIIQSVWNFIFP